MKRTNRPEENRTERKKRPPINGKGDVLSLSGLDDNYQYRVFNDKGTRIAQHQDYGWEVVAADDVTIGTRNDVSTAGTAAAVTVDSNDGTQGIVMRIRKDWYDEDQTAKQAKIAETEKAITGENNENGNYGKVSIEN